MSNYVVRIKTTTLEIYIYTILDCISKADAVKRALSQHGFYHNLKDMTGFVATKIN